MNILALKLILAPLIIGSASLAGRRWGPAVSGWLVALPLTSGPIIFFVAVSEGISFAARSALGVLSGGISVVIYAVVYPRLAVRFPWQVSITGSLFAFLLSTLFFQNVELPFWLVSPAVLLLITGGLSRMPDEKVETGNATLSKWDIPLRILIGTGIILLITGIAPFIGPRLTGLLTTIPLYSTILVIFAHRSHGPAAAGNVMRGLLFGLFAFTGFFIVLSLLIERTSLAVSFGLAALTALAVQGTSLFILRKLHG
ncbi:MAG: hypothetical protein HS100_02295 [Anaerolineales bacterium]|nr:MAG: hypothetical protein EDM79_03810 [Chloroflexota bacterium]MBE7432722.1 hypothetical protein [Anaerolineales bacterium]